MSVPRPRKQQVEEPVLLAVGRSLALPIAVAAFFLHRYLKRRKAAASAGQQSQQKSQEQTKPAAKTHTKPRRDYKVKRSHVDESAAEEERQYQQQMQAVGLGADNVMESYNEDEVDALGEAASQPGQGNNMISMLQSMGFRMVMGQNGQLLMVPPDYDLNKLQGEHGEEGEDDGMGEYMEEGDDEEGYDEDEDHEEA